MECPVRSIGLVVPLVRRIKRLRSLLGGLSSNSVRSASSGSKESLDASPWRVGVAFSSVMNVVELAVRMEVVVDREGKMEREEEEEVVLLVVVLLEDFLEVQDVDETLFEENPKLKKVNDFLNSNY